MKKKFSYPFLLAISLVAALGGLLFGYDWVVIGGAKPFYELYFDISSSPAAQGWAMSSALLGCMVGAAVSGVLSDLYGRKYLLLVSAVLFIVSAYGTGAAEFFSNFIVYRIIGGIGIGMASTLAPMYIAEIAPSESRGMFVSINQFTIVVGILAAQITNMVITRPVPEGFTSMDILHSWNGKIGWRWMFWAELVPAVLFFILIFFIPESPRYLAQKNKLKKARAVLYRIGGAGYADGIIQKMRVLQGGDQAKQSLRTLLDKRALSILFIGIVLAAFQQWCGINIIFNYAQEIFVSAGYGINELFINIVITGSINLIFTLLSMGVVDRLGRKKLMLLGSGGLTLIYLVLGLFYFMGVTGLPMLLLVLLAIAVYAVSLAPVTWVILSEIFPNRFRGIAMSIATFSLWVASALLVQSFPFLNENLGTSGTFWIYSLICAGGFFFVKARLPETKNKSLEEIEEALFPSRDQQE